jgi:hypothetical protein
MSLLVVAVTLVAASYSMVSKPFEVEQTVDTSEAVQVLNDVEGIAQRVEDPGMRAQLNQKVNQLEEEFKRVEATQPTPASPDHTELYLKAGFSLLFGLAALYITRLLQKSAWAVWSGNRF